MRNDPIERKTVLSPTDARQASPRRMNLRVLITSLFVLAIIGTALMLAYQNTAVEDGGTKPGPGPAATTTDQPKTDPASRP